MIVLYGTLFPFDFFLREKLSVITLLEHGNWSLFAPEVRPDIPRNVLLFVPLGLGLFYLLPASGIVRLALTVATATLFSTLIELTQFFLLVRFIALADIVANGVGALIGGMLALLLGQTLPRRLAVAVAVSIRALYGLRLAAIVIWSLWLLAMALVALSLQQRASLSNWSAGYPLLIGNEATGDRHWQGTLRAFYITDTLLSPNTLQQTLAGGDPRTLIGDQLLAGYELRADGRYVSLTPGMPSLERQPGASGIWWKSETPPDRLVSAITATGRFTLIADLSTATEEQEGPARILSISPTPMDRNLTIGQEGADLVVRLRTPLSDANGRYPELRVANVFSEPRPQRLVITYGMARLDIFLSNPDRTYSFQYSPEMMMLYEITPVDAYTLTLNTLPVWFFHALYNAVVFFPAGVLLALTFRESRTDRVRVIVLSLAILLPPVLLAAQLAQIGGYPLEAGDVVLGIVFGAAALLFVRNIRLGVAHVFALP